MVRVLDRVDNKTAKGRRARRARVLLLFTTGGLLDGFQKFLINVG